MSSFLEDLAAVSPLTSGLITRKPCRSGPPSRAKAWLDATGFDCLCNWQATAPFSSLNLAICAGRKSLTMKFVEQQLVAALADTPHATECSVSVAVLNGFRLLGEEAQAGWLNRHRPARDGKSWRCRGERWEYAATTNNREQTRPPFSAPSTSTWRTSHLTPERASPIMVKPLAPLRKPK